MMLHLVHDGEPPPTRRGSGWAWVPRRRDVGLIELVAALVGEPGLDPPPTVHPVLAAIGGAVSDLSSPAGRRELRPLALSFPGTADVGPATSARLVDLCTSAALASPGELTRRQERRLGQARRLARSLLRESEDAPTGAARWWLPATRLAGLDEPFYRSFVAPGQVAEAVRALAGTCGPDRDRRLHTLLLECLALFRREDRTTRLDLGRSDCTDFRDPAAPPTRHRVPGSGSNVTAITYGIQSTTCFGGRDGQGP